MINQRKLKQLVFGLSFCIVAGTASSQSDVEIKVVPAAGSISMLVGQGGNIGVFSGTDGTFLVDDQYAPLTAKILDAVKTIGGDTPKFLINTHFHGDHTGGNENMGDAGTIILSHDNVRKRLAEGSMIAAFKMETPPQAGSALPSITFSKDMTVHLNGEAVHIIHVANAHTDGDSIVHFTSSNVIHAGDTFFNGFFPFIDADHGGTLSGTVAAADRMLTLADDNTVIIPGHGALSNKAELQIYRDMLATANERLSALKKQGQNAQQINASQPLADLDEQWGKAMFNATRWVEIIYDGI
jgi:cyclase